VPCRPFRGDLWLNPNLAASPHPCGTSAEQQDGSELNGQWRVAVSTKVVKMTAAACPPLPPGIRVNAVGDGLQALALRMAAGPGNATDAGRAPAPVPAFEAEPAAPPPAQCPCNCTAGTPTSATSGAP
jgi:hypothetical protein